MSIIGNPIMAGASGPVASIFVTGLSETDTVTATNGSKTLTGKWTQKLNPAFIELPAGYTQLEYIESTGTQRINTGLYMPNGWHIVADIEFTGFNSGANGIWGVEGSSPEYRNDFSYQYNNNIAGWFVGYGGYFYGGSAIVNTPYHVDVCNIRGNFSIKINGNTVSGTVGSSENANRDSREIPLFAILVGSAYYYSKMRVKTWKVYSSSDNSNLVANYVPAKRNSDGVFGLYDLVSNTFLSNAGTGEFVAGPEIPQSFDGFLIKPIRDFGTWTVTATNGTDTYTQDVLVDVITEYEIEMSYKLWLYRDGDECVDVTGGWSNYSDTSKYSISTLVKNNDNLYSQNNTTYGLAGTGNLIDLTNYSTLYAEIKTGTGGNSSGWVGSSVVTAKEWYQEKDNPPAFALFQQGSTACDTTKYSLDVSALSGSYYVTIVDYVKSFNIYKVWLE